MKIFSLKKYDDFILSTFKSRKAQYFFLKLPLILLGIVLLAVGLATGFINISFILIAAAIGYVMSKPKKIKLLLMTLCGILIVIGIVTGFVSIKIIPVILIIAYLMSKPKLKAKQI